jgi:hypothetical protein
MTVFRDITFLAAGPASERGRSATVGRQRDEDTAGQEGDLLMKRKPNIKYEYRHMGVPTPVPRAGEKYSSTFRMYASGGEDPAGFRIQYHRFEDGSPLHPLLRTMPHVAFKVDNLDAAIEGEEVLLGPYCPFEGFRVAVIEDSGVPTELIQTNLSEEEIWGAPKAKSVIYPEDRVPDGPGTLHRSEDGDDQGELTPAR